MEFRIDDSSVAFAADDGSGAFHFGDYVDFADSSRGVVATVGACDVAERTRRAEVADGGSRSVGEDIVGHGDESVFFNEHSSVFHDDGETVDVGVDDKPTSARPWLIRSAIWVRFSGIGSGCGRICR